MNKNTKVNAAILIIGNEILSGRTQDINTKTISLWLNTIGIKVTEVTIIPDIEQTIIDTINEFKKRFNYVFTSGGIGPTHDDITAQSVSKAFNIEYGPHKEAMKILENYYQPGEFSEGRQKMAWMPVSAKLIYNPSSGAPGFNVENVYCLPGVPSYIKSLFGRPTNALCGGHPIITAQLCFSTGQTAIAKSLSNVQDNNKDVDIGSYPFFKAGKLGVSIVLRSPEQKKIDKCNSEILKFVKEKNIELVEGS